MVGIPDYQAYVEHRRIFHPDQPIRGVLPGTPECPLRSGEWQVPRLLLSGKAFCPLDQIVSVSRRADTSWFSDQLKMEWVR